MFSGSGFTDKVAVVMGGGGIGGVGIGPSISSLLAEAGAKLAIVDIDAGRAEFVARRITSQGKKALAITADVRDSRQINHVVQASLAEFGQIDVLVNIIGGTPMIPALEMDENLWDELMVMNLKYVWLTSKAVATTMIEQRRKGSIVNVASVSGLTAGPLQAAYAAAKAGLISLTKSLAVEWGRYYIRVNSIAPGSVDTPTSREYYARHPEAGERRKEPIPLGRLGTPEDMAGAILWLASDLADFVTGQTIGVDGGFLLNPIWRLSLAK